MCFKRLTDLAISENLLLTKFNDDSQPSNFMCLTNSNTQTSKIDDRKYETQTRPSLIRVFSSLQKEK